MLQALSITRHFDNSADTITLDETARHRRRMRMVSDSGIAFLLDLPKARLLRHGDGLVLEDGRVIQVRAAPEPLYEIKAQDARHLLMLTWHIGNRHLAAQIETDRILIRQDHVIRAMLEGLGASVAEISGPFDPEGGAYDHVHSSIGGVQSGHAHSHDHD